MARPRVSVIDESASIRETIAILLDDCDVTGYAPEVCSSGKASLGSPDLMIIQDLVLATSTLASLPSGVPILWLREEPGTWRTERQAALPRKFTPAQLRTEVERILAPGKTQSDALAVGLSPPLLPAEADQIADAASRTLLPLLVSGEPGTGKLRLLQEIHARSGAPDLLSLPAHQCENLLRDKLTAGTSAVSVIVRDVESLGIDGSDLLLEIAQTGGLRVHGAVRRPVRLLCSTTLPPEDLEGAGLPTALLHAITLLTVRLPALRDRREELPEIIHAVARSASRRLRVAAPEFTAEALHRLTHYLWFGNLAEMEAVLTRTLAVSRIRPVGANDLLFGLGPSRARPSPAAHPTREDSGAEESPAGPSAPTSSGTTQFEIVINELAHEFKNPMVTIKTISQHIDRLLADESSRKEVTHLVSEAIDRMDRTLEHLLQFTRFSTPAPAEVNLNALLAPCLTEAAPLLTERGVVLNYQPPASAVVYVDRDQAVYAIDSLLRSLLHDLAEGDSLTVHPGPTPQSLAFEVSSRNRSVAERIHRYLDDSAPGPEPESLGHLFARTLIERNGGRLQTAQREETQQTLLTLPERRPTN